MSQEKGFTLIELLVVIAIIALSTAAWDNILRLSRIQSPGDKYVFIEENDPRGYNINSWVIDSTYGTASTHWSDPMALWHFSHNNFAFADGHTEEWKWSQETLEFFGEIEHWYTPGPQTIQEKEDLQRVLRSWP